MTERSFPLTESDIDLRCNARKECRRRAIYIVRIHRVNECHHQSATPAGENVYLMCAGDAGSTAFRLGMLVGEMYSQEETAIPCCGSCGKALSEVDDIMIVENL